MSPTRPSNSNAIIWAVVSLLALLYFVTSLVVVINSFVWMATFPSFWYGLQRVIYWPFQPYFGFTLSVLGGREISYQVYALISRSPFLIVPLLIGVAALRRARPGKSKA